MGNAGPSGVNLSLSLFVWTSKTKWNNPEQRATRINDIEQKEENKRRSLLLYDHHPHPHDHHDPHHPVETIFAHERTKRPGHSWLARRMPPATSMSQRNAPTGVSGHSNDDDALTSALPDSFDPNEIIDLQRHEEMLERLNRRLADEEEDPEAKEYREAIDQAKELSKTVDIVCVNCGFSLDLERCAGNSRGDSVACQCCGVYQNIKERTEAARLGYSDLDLLRDQQEILRSLRAQDREHERRMRDGYGSEREERSERSQYHEESVKRRRIGNDRYEDEMEQEPRAQPQLSPAYYYRQYLDVDGVEREWSDEEDGQPRRQDVFDETDMMNSFLESNEREREILRPVRAFAENHGYFDVDENTHHSPRFSGRPRQFRGDVKIHQSRGAGSRFHIKKEGIEISKEKRAAAAKRPLNASFNASLLAICCLTNTGKRLYDSFQDVKGNIFIEWSPYAAMYIWYKQPSFEVMWKVTSQMLRPESCMYKRKAEDKTFELLLGVFRPPDIKIRANRSVERSDCASVFGSHENSQLDNETRQITSENFERSRDHDSYAINSNSSDLEKLGFQFMDSIFLRFEETAEVMEGSEMFKFLTDKKYMYPTSCRFAINRVPKHTTYLVSQGWDGLSFMVRWKLCVLISQGWLTPRAVSDEFVRSLIEAGDELAVRTLDLMGEYVFHKNDKLCVDNAFPVLQYLLSKYKQKFKKPRPISQAHCLWVAHVEVSPTKFYCRGPFAEVSNRMLRQYEDKTGDFFRITFVREDLDVLHAKYGPVINRIRQVLDEGIEIFGRKFSFLIYSQSQLRSSSCWFLADDSEVSVSEVVSWMGNATNIKTAGKYAARLGLSLSATRPALPLLPSEYELLGDIMSSNGEYEMTDGCGEISAVFAAEISQQLGEDYVPSAFQIRYAGFKGMLVVNPNLPVGIKVRFRKSMKKMESDAQLLEVCEASKFRNAFTNRQILFVQSALGVRHETLLNMQNQFIEDLRALLENPRKATEFLYKGGAGSDRDWEFSLALLISQGFNMNDVFLRTTLQDIVRWALELVRRKSRIRVDDGALLFGVYDFSGKLKPNEVLVQVNRPVGQSKESRLVNILGRVMVTRSPCMHLGDIRVLKAVEPPPELAHLQDVIVFSIQGDRSACSMMGLGDMDGDFYSVYWDPALVPRKECYPFVYQPKSSPDLGRNITLDDIKKFFLLYLCNNDTGMISNAHLVWADTFGHGCEPCLQLVELANDAIDFSKTGVPAVLPEHLKVRSYPDFMEKATRRSYRSKSILGKLWRQVMRVYKEFDGLTLCTNVEIPEFDPMLAYEDIPEEIGVQVFAEASSTKRQYDRELTNLMSQFQVRSETQFFSGAFVTFEDALGRDKHMSEKASVALSVLKAKYRELFYRGIREAATSEEEANEFCMMRAAAWYFVTYKAHLVPPEEGNPVRPAVPFRSFPWLVPEELIKLRRHNIQKTQSRQEP